MRIQHNIAALNSYRNLTNNNSAVAKNLEKLSSGYRINRAGDDAAGLAISEKMRAQITGLNTAQKNANDGISLVQTAEGALTEVHSMLNRMVELATQSANGTYAEGVDRDNLQKEITSLKDEINRISESTNYNGIKLLDGTLAGSTTTTANFKVGGEAGAAGTLPAVGTTLGVNTVKHNDVEGANDGTTFSIDLHNFKFDNAVGSTLTIGIGDQSIVLDGDGSGALEDDALVEAIVNAANTNGDGAGGKLTIDGQTFTAAAGTNGDARITFTQDNKTTDADFKEVQVANTVNIKQEGGAAAAPSYSLAITAPKDGYAAGTYQINGQEFKVGDAADDDITVADTKDATKLAQAIAAKLNGNVDTEYTITADGAKLVYEPADPTATPAATPSELKIVSSAGNISFGTVTETTKGLDAATADVAAKYTFEVTAPENAFAEGDSFTVGGQTIAVGAGGDISVDDAKDATKLAAAIATKLQAAGATGYGITSDGNKIVYTATTAGAVGGTTTGVPAAAPTQLTGNNGVTIGQMVEAQKGRDNGDAAVAAAYEVAITAPTTELAAGTKITIAGQEIEVGKDITVPDTTDADKWAALLADKLTAEGYDVTAGTGKLVYTAQTAGAVGGTTTGVPTAAPTAPTAPATGDSTTVLGTPAATATDGSKGIDYNVSTTVIREAKAGDGYRLASTHFELTKDMVQDKASITIGKSTYTFSTEEADKGKEGKVYIGDVKDDLSEIAKRLTDAAAANKTYTVGHDGNRVTVTEIKDQTEFAENGKSTLTTVEAIEKSLGFTSAPTASQALTLQIGDTAETFNQLRVAVGGMSSADLGIGDIDISTQTGATAAIDKIKEAINSVSSTRGDLGAIQNRLEHTINSLSVTAENMTAAESRIRDVDMAEEMMAYTKNNILVQAAQAMLAQANQVPQGVLQLLQ